MHDYPEPVATLANSPIGGYADKAALHNPTVAENIDRQIAFHKDEIARLEKIKTMFPEQMLAMNIRDMRNALNF